MAHEYSFNFHQHPDDPDAAIAAGGESNLLETQSSLWFLSAIGDLPQEQDPHNANATLVPHWAVAR